MNTMKNKSFFIGRWTYDMPDTKPNPDGRIVLIRMLSFGPLEVYEWGIDAGGLPYEEYKWIENDFYADENYFKHIKKQALTEQIENLISLFIKHESPEWASIYKEILGWLNNNSL